MVTFHRLLEGRSWFWAPCRSLAMRQLLYFKLTSVSTEAPHLGHGEYEFRYRQMWPNGMAWCEYQTMMIWKRRPWLVKHLLAPAATEKSDSAMERETSENSEQNRNPLQTLLAVLDTLRFLQIGCCCCCRWWWWWRWWWWCWWWWY